MAFDLIKMKASLTKSVFVIAALCVSHRGGRMEFDENTMLAFKASYDARCIPWGRLYVY